MYQITKVTKSRSVIYWGIQRPAKSCSPAMNLLHSLSSASHSQGGISHSFLDWPLAVSRASVWRQEVNSPWCLPLAASSISGHCPITVTHNKAGAFRLMKKIFCTLSFLFYISCHTNSFLICLSLALFLNSFVFIPTLPCSLDISVSEKYD